MPDGHGGDKHKRNIAENGRNQHLITDIGTSHDRGNHNDSDEYRTDDGDKCNTTEKDSDQQPTTSERAPILPGAPTHSRTIKPPVPYLQTHQNRSTESFSLVSIPNEDGYAWSNDQLRCTHQNSPALDKQELVDSSCAVLSYFSAYYSPICGAIVSIERSSILPMNIIHARLTQSLSMRVKTSGHKLEDLIEHIRTTFSIPSTQTIDTINKELSYRRFTTLPPGLPEPQKARRCPTCKGWYSEQVQVLQGLKNHWNKSGLVLCGQVDSEGRLKEAKGRRKHNNGAHYFESAYTSMAFKSVTSPNNRSMRLVMSEDWVPPTPVPQKEERYMPAPTPYTPPAFLVDLGWIDHIRELNMPIPVLLGYLSLPTPRLYVQGLRARTFEDGLAVLVKVIKAYLVHADIRVSTFHGRLRDAIPQQ